MVEAGSYGESGLREVVTNSSVKTVPVLCPLRGAQDGRDPLAIRTRPACDFSNLCIKSSQDPRQTRMYHTDAVIQWPLTKFPP